MSTVDSKAVAVVTERLESQGFFMGFFLFWWCGGGVCGGVVVGGGRGRRLGGFTSGFGA